jgi:CubicO group peptidase (beta-lactamase class C family)
MRSDPIMPLASVGKMYTATAAMILVDRGVMALDDPVSRFLPDFANVVVAVTDSAGRTSTVRPDRPITVRHLLTHTAGLRVAGDSFWAAWNVHAARSTTTALAHALAALPLQSHPGATFAYGATGASYDVLAAVIEAASGVTLEAFLTRNLFDPLRLADTHFYVPTAQAARLPAFFRRVNGVLQLRRAHGVGVPRTTFFHGSGGVASSPQDILRFAQIFLNDGTFEGVRVLTSESVQGMMSDQLGAGMRLRGGLRWGFGAALRFEDEPNGRRVLRQYGWVGGGYAKLWVDPLERIVAYFAFPLEPPGDNALLDEFERLVQQALAAGRGGDLNR